MLWVLTLLSRVTPEYNWFEMTLDLSVLDIQSWHRSSIMQTETFMTQTFATVYIFNFQYKTTREVYKHLNSF